MLVFFGGVYLNQAVETKNHLQVVWVFSGDCLLPTYIATIGFHFFSGSCIDKAVLVQRKVKEHLDAQVFGHVFFSPGKHR